MANDCTYTNNVATCSMYTDCMHTYIVYALSIFALSSQKYLNF